jgi:hypothetical protein
MISSGLRPTPETFQILSQAKSPDPFADDVGESSDTSDTEMNGASSKAVLNKGFGKKVKHLQQSFSEEVVRRRGPLGPEASAVASASESGAANTVTPDDSVEDESEDNQMESSSSSSDDDAPLPTKLTMFQQISARPASTTATHEELVNKSKQELIKLPLTKLRDMATAAKLKKSGNKSELVERIVAHKFRRP